MEKAKEISALWSEIKPQIGELVRLCHEVESHAEVTADAYQRGYKEAYDTAYADAEKIYESGKRAMYQKGLKDAWEAARKIASDCAGRNYSIFGQHFTVEILNTHSASECIEKIRQYEQEQEEIKPGNEVIGICKSGIKTDPFVIIQKLDDYYFGIYSRTGEFCQGGLKLQKTGRDFPELIEVLEKMKGET